MAFLQLVSLLLLMACCFTKPVRCQQLFSVQLLSPRTRNNVTIRCEESNGGLRLPMVTSNNEGMYQCEATATVRSGLQGSPLLSVLAPIIDLEVFGE